MVIAKKKELEDAIAALENQRSVLGDAVVDPAIDSMKKQLETLEETQEQRKQVSILFADISGFTALSETMDAEDINTVMNELWQEIDQVVIDHGGYIDKHIGDAVMAIWGVPTAQENDPEQATQAGLAMQTGLHAFREEKKINLTMRVGINTGPVLLGEVGTTGEYTAMGDTVNTASRLEHAAPLSGVLISHTTYQHVRGIFDIDALDPIAVKGKAELLQVYWVKRAKPRAFRRGTRGIEGIETQMIGRDLEMETLQNVFQMIIKSNQTQVVTLVGEAGVGKSRLLYEFENWVDLLPNDVRLFKARARPETKNQPFGLIRDLFTFRFEIHENDQIPEVRKKLEQGIATILQADKNTQMKAHFIGQLLGFDFSSSDYIKGALDDAKQIRDRALAYIIEILEVFASDTPVIILLEDLHWADNSSLEILVHLFNAFSIQPILFLNTTRPVLFETQPGWGSDKESHIRLELNALSRRDSRYLVEEILQKVIHIPNELQELIVGNAEGNPFYVEELVKMLLENGTIIKGEDHWHIQFSKLKTLEIPSTLTGVLQSRLDNLPSNEHKLLQQASVVGRVFWDDILRYINHFEKVPGRDTIQDILKTLQNKELIFERETSAFVGAIEYIFKHAMLREVTYECVLKRDRITYHDMVAEWLITRGGDRVDEYAGLIADHLALGSKENEAIRYINKAGEIAASNYANREALTYFSQALEIIPQQDTKQRFTLLESLEKIHNILGDREAQQKDLRKLSALASDLGDDENARLALRKNHFAAVTSDYEQAIIHAKTAIEYAKNADKPELAAEAHLRWGGALLRQGQYQAAQEQFQNGLLLAKKADNYKHEASCLNGLGIISDIQGNCSRAREYFEQYLTISRKIGNRSGEGLSLGNLGVLAMYQGDYKAAAEYHEQSLLIRREMGDRRGEGYCLINLGSVAWRQGENSLAKEYFAESLVICRETGNRREEGHILNELGVIALNESNLSLAEDYFQQTLSIHQEMKLPQYLVEDWAGFAKLKIVQNEPYTAREFGKKILDYLKENPRLAGTENPMRTFHLVWEIWSAIDETAETAAQVLTLAVAVIQDYLDKNRDPELQKMYLQQPHHAALWNARPQANTI